MRRRLRAAAFALGIAAGTLLVTACPVPPPGAVYVRVGPPPIRSEVIGIAPGPGYVWVNGYWTWNGAEYIWVPGTWQRPPHSGAIWVRAHWRHHRNGWYFVEGHWK